MSALSAPSAAILKSGSRLRRTPAVRRNTSGISPIAAAVLLTSKRGLERKYSICVVRNGYDRHHQRAAATSNRSTPSAFRSRKNRPSATSPLMTERRERPNAAIRARRESPRSVSRHHSSTTLERLRATDGQMRQVEVLVFGMRVLAATRAIQASRNRRVPRVRRKVADVAVAGNDAFRPASCPEGGSRSQTAPAPSRSRRRRRPRVSRSVERHGRRHTGGPVRIAVPPLLARFRQRLARRLRRVGLRESELPIAACIP